MSVEASHSLVEEINAQIERHRSTNWVDMEPEARSFAAAFLLTPSPRKAAAEAGLRPDRGSKLFKDPIVRAYIQHLQEAAIDVNIINAAYLRAKLLDAIEIFSGEVAAPTAVPGAGVMDVEKVHGPELMRALDMLAKSVGFYNADLSQNSFMQVMEMMREAGQRRQADLEPISPASFRLESDDGA